MPGQGEGMSAAWAAPGAGASPNRMNHGVLSPVTSMDQTPTHASAATGPVAAGVESTCADEDIENVASCLQEGSAW